MILRRTCSNRLFVWTAAIAAMTAMAGSFVGCGLGYIEIQPERSIKFAIQNATADTAEVTISIEDANDVESEPGSFGSDESTLGTFIRVPGGNEANGRAACGDRITVAVSLSSDASTRRVELTGAGTGTPGFDSGTIGTAGERILLRNAHFSCDDTIFIQLAGAENGEISVIPQGSLVPSLPEIPGDDADNDSDDSPDDGSDDGSNAPSGGGQAVDVRLENATAKAADVSITVESSDSASTDTPPTVRVPAGQFSSGKLTCGGTFTISVTIDDTSDSTVLLTGDGTGTPGFDSASIGLSGERLLVFGDHYTCGETIVVRITDDGSGIGLSTSETPLGEVAVFSDASVVPDPVLPDPDDPGTLEPDDQVTLVVVNSVESTVQVNFATGNGSLAGSGGVDVSSEFEVRVPPGDASVGVGPCAQEYVLAAAHLEATGSTISTTSGDAGPFAGGASIAFHGVVLTGDGTGTEGFDSNSIAIERGRLLQLGTHFQCGDTITVEVTATNNQFQLDGEGNMVVDEFGNPTIKYNVGFGEVTVTGGG